MTPYFENSLVTIYHNRAEHILPCLERDSFGCIILDPPVSMRSVQECDYLIDAFSIIRLVRSGGIIYTLANPDQGVFVTVRGPHGERSSTIFSPMKSSKPIPLYGHQATRPAAAMKGLLMSTSGRILDPYCGIGTTLVAAKELGRQAVGVEIEEKFCKVAADLLAA